MTPPESNGASTHLALAMLIRGVYMASTAGKLQIVRFDERCAALVLSPYLLPRPEFFNESSSYVAPLC